MQAFRSKRRNDKKEPSYIDAESDISLIKTKNGNRSIKLTGDDGSQKTLHSLYDPEAEARNLVKTFEFDGRGILVVLGLGLGYHVKELP